MMIGSLRERVSAYKSSNQDTSANNLNDKGDSRRRSLLESPDTTNRENAGTSFANIKQSHWIGGIADTTLQACIQ